MTPAPTTVMARGSRRRRMMSSLVMATSPSTGEPGGVTGWVPTAITTLSAVIVRFPASPRTARVWGSTRLPRPG